MAIASKQLLAFVFATPFFLLLVPNNVHSQPDTTIFEFNPFYNNSNDLTWDRDAHIPSNSNFVSLTKTIKGFPQNYSVGRVRYSQQVKFSDENRQASFYTIIRFSIKQVNNDPGDGLTFFIVPFNSTTVDGGEGYSLGIFNTLNPPESPIFAIEFDTHSNDVDPGFPHIGININSIKSAKVTPFEGGGQNKEVTAHINYVSTTGNITVVAEYGLNISSVSHVSNLKKLLPDVVQVGISASTGSLVQVHEVYSWFFTSSMVPFPDNDNIRQHVM